MAMQAVVGGLGYFPSPPHGSSTGPGLTTATLNITATGHKVAGIFKATAAKSIRAVYVRTATVTTGDTMDVRIESVDGTTGDPTGTLWGTNTNVSLVIANGDDSVWLKTGSLTADALLAVGDAVAVVIVNGSSGNMQIAGWPEDFSNTLFPYGELFTAAWVKQAVMPLLMVEYSDGTYSPIHGVTQTGGAITTTTFNSSTAANRRGNMFSLPGPVQADGCWIWMDADGDFIVNLYDTDGTTTLATTGAHDADMRVSGSPGLVFLPFTTTASLSANSNYRIAVIPTSVTNLTTYEFDVPDVDMMGMFPGGTNVKASVYTSGAWGETTTRRGFLGIHISGIGDDASGGGKGGTRPFRVNRR